MIYNAETVNMEIDPKSYEVKIFMPASPDSDRLNPIVSKLEAARNLPMSQKYFLF